MPGTDSSIDTETDRPGGFPPILKIVVGVLAVIGLVSIIGTLVSGIVFGAKVAFAMLVVFLLFKGVQSVLRPRSRNA